MEHGFLSKGYITIISHIISITQLYRMITQVRAKKREREKMATLEIHPEIQVKLQLSRLGENKNQVVATAAKQESKEVGETDPNEE